MSKNISAVIVGAVGFLLAFQTASADNQTLPDFQGRDSAYSNFRTRIIAALQDGPNFSGNYTLITIGCGTECTFHMVASNQTGEIHSFPFGGEQNTGLILEYDLDSSRIFTSFLDNTDEDGGIPRYSPYNPLECRFLELEWTEGQFVEIQAAASRSYNRPCPPATLYFEQMVAGKSSFDRACTPNLIEFNVCEYASNLAEEIADKLPVQHSPDLQWRGVHPEGNLIRAYLQWQVTDTTMQRMLNQGGMTIDDLQVRMIAATNALACSDDVLRAFINLGGVMEYQHRNLDITEVAIIPVNECPE